MRWKANMAAVGIALVTGCGSTPSNDTRVSSTSRDLAATKVYDADFHFTSPKTCSMHVKQVITDTNARAIEFDVIEATSKEPFSATYLVVPTDPVPLHLIVSAGAQGSAKTVFSVFLSATEEKVFDANDNGIFDEPGYFSQSSSSLPAPPSAPGSQPGLALSEALYLAQCSLEMQSTFGILPALDNLHDAVVSPGVRTDNADGAPLIADWPTGQTFGESFFHAVGCLTVGANGLRWSCKAGS
jgi:hypothetical protein